MEQLIKYQPKRLLSFGCSFTKYFWTTWPEYVSDALNIPFYNFGKSGAGNQYIANVLMQADKILKINSDDLVIVSWTNVCREDRWVKGNWLLTGNIYSQGIYDQNFVTKFADPVGYYIRDLATINLIKEFLDHKGCQYKFLSMCNILERQDQGEDHNLIEDQSKKTYNSIVNLYADVTKIILPSFYEVLWEDDIHKNKFDIERKELTPLFLDGHPNPYEHWKYIKSVFDYSWPDYMEHKAQTVQDNFKKIIKEHASTQNKQFAIYDRPRDFLDKLRAETLVSQSQIVKYFS